MCEVVDRFVSHAWDYLKRLFGRSKTIFGNVVGLLGVAWVEVGSDLMNFDWDSLFKHEVAVGIGIATQIFNLVIRFYTVGPVSFGPLPNSLEPERFVAPVEDVSSLEEGGPDKNASAPPQV